MALNITSTFTTRDGFEVSTGYGRVSVLNPMQGTDIQARVDIFASESSYEAKNYPVEILNLQNQVVFQYDYATDSKDILDLAHDQLIALLAGQGITATKNL